jgi:hypothetical protein
VSSVSDRLLADLAEADEFVRAAGKAFLDEDPQQTLELVGDAWLLLRDLHADLGRELNEPEPGRSP